MDGLLLFAELVFLSIKPSSSSIIFNSFAAIASNDRGGSCCCQVGTGGLMLARRW